MACSESLTAHLRHVSIYLTPRESEQWYTGGLGAVLAGSFTNYQEVEADFYLSEESAPHQIYQRLCSALRRANGHTYYIVVSLDGSQQYYDENYQRIEAQPNEGARVFEHPYLEQIPSTGQASFETEVYTLYLSV